MSKYMLMGHTWPTGLGGPLLRLVNVNKQCVEVEAVWQDVVPDRAAAHAQCVQGHGVLALGYILDCLQVGIHGDVDTCVQGGGHCRIVWVHKVVAPMCPCPATRSTRRPAQAAAPAMILPCGFCSTTRGLAAAWLGAASPGR
eukprot:365390-Chlamydomonas_euryale.AAC.7